MPRGIYERKPRKKARKGPMKAAANYERFTPEPDLSDMPVMIQSKPEGYISEDTYRELCERHRLSLLELAEVRVEWLRLQLDVAMQERDVLMKERKH